MMLMASANDLVIVFLALEILSIALYVLAAFDRRRLTSQEAGPQVLPARLVLVRDLPLRHRARVRRDRARRTSPGIATFLATTTLLHDGVLLVGFAFLLVGLGFKVAAAPFHMWTPDVYQGAPTPVTAFMAAATKAAAFAALLRIFVGAFHSVRRRLAARRSGASPCCRCSSAAIAALVQTDVKRMLAYSSISHAGYVLIGVQAATRKGTSAALFYLLVYALMAIGAFAVVIGAWRAMATTATRSPTYRGLAPAARARGICSRCSCSRRRACR